MLGLMAMPLVVQGVAMLADERLHRRRGLPRWERIGHPLDTLTVLACWAWLVFTPPTRTHAWVYAALAAFSCLFVTKDEPLHATRCSRAEHWLHAILFVLHPVVLGVGAFLWWTSQLRIVLVGELALTGSVFAYQLLYWNGPWHRGHHAP